MADLRIVDSPLLSTVKGTEKIPTGGEGNFSVSVNQVVDFAKLKWFLATEEYVDNAVGNVQADLNLHKNSVSNPHQVTKAQVGLGNVDNTADLDKPVSNATQSAIITANSGKADKSYVDSQDQLKADKVTVEASLLLKADKVDLTASKILSDGNQTQQSINNFGGAKWYAKSGGYDLGATVKLTNGDIVKSTVANNIVNPNVDMTGWVNPEADQKEINEKLKGREIWLEDYPQVKFNGTTEDGVAIQAILQPITEDGVTVHFKKNAKCLIGSSTVRGLFLGLKKNWTFDLNGCEILRGSGKTPITYNNTIELVLCERTKFKNGSVNGQNELSGGVEGQCHNIALYGCNLTTFHDFVSHNAVTDNLYQTKINEGDYRDNGLIRYTNTGGLIVNSSVFLVNSKFPLGYRQGMTIGVSKNIFAVNCFFGFTGKSLAGGISPTAGVDSEPNATGNYNYVESIKFINCDFVGNAGAGCVVDYRNFSASFDNCNFLDNDFSGLNCRAQLTAVNNCRFIGNNKAASTTSAFTSVDSQASYSTPRTLNLTGNFFLNNIGDVRVSEGVFLNLINSISVRGSGNFLLVSQDSAGFSTNGGAIKVDGLNVQGKQFLSANSAEVIRAITLSTNVSIKNVTGSTGVLKRCAATIGETQIRAQTTFEGVEVGDIVDWSGVPAGTKVTSIDSLSRFAQIDSTVTITTQQADINFITPNPQTKFAYITNSPNVTEFKNLNLKGFSLVHDTNIPLTGDRSRILLDGVLQQELCGQKTLVVATRSIPANSSYTTVTMTISGARAGDSVQVSSSADLLGCVLYAYVSGNNAVKVQITNPTTAAITIPEITLRVKLTSIPF